MTSAEQALVAATSSSTAWAGISSSNAVARASPTIWLLCEITRSTLRPSTKPSPSPSRSGSSAARVPAKIGDATLSSASTASTAATGSPGKAMTA